ncbi:MAG: hypothetical protein LBT43_18510, partial [Prevotella sp.]|nr:hypothetical protein [Prevotella sp.]
ERSTVTAYYRTTVTAYNRTTVTAYNRATVTAYDRATVTASDGSVVISYEPIECTIKDKAIHRVLKSNTIRYTSDDIHFKKVEQS